ncbi:MAG: imelysin family protein [Sulfurovum sp.]
MKNKLILGCSIVLSVLLFTACGSSDNDNNNGSDSDNGTYTKIFKAKSSGDQVEELMGGIIGIVDEVGNGKMGDPLGENIGDADTTKVESQFSWNSTMDFYNNIISIKNIFDGGLRVVAQKVDSVKMEEIDSLLNQSLALIIAISDHDGDLKLTTSDLLANDGELAFRNQVKSTDGRNKIISATAKLSVLQAKLEAFKPSFTSAVTDADKEDLAKVVDNVIVKGYTDLAREAQKLSMTLTTLKDSPTSENITLAREQWRGARLYWESGEGHIFGPVDTLGVDPKVDSWPVDKTQLDGALSGWNPDLSNIDGFPVTMKGFHAMEYLLFGDGSALENEEASATRLQTPIGEDDASEKLRLKYLEAMGLSFAKDIQSLVDAW